jgi:hypothetical protein
MTLGDRAAALAVTAVVMTALAWASVAPMPVHGSADAVLRVAWSARPERVERCRERSAEELAALPAHMRQPVACEGAAAQYRLTVTRNGLGVVDRVVRGGGLRHDRRLYVLDEIPMPAGDVAIEVRFDRLGTDATGASGAAATREAGHPERAVPQAETVPPQLALTERLSVHAREVVLVTYSAEHRSLVIVRKGADPRRRDETGAR